MHTPNIPLIVALDVGTTSVRALVFDARGNRLSALHATRPSPLRTTPDGGAEMDPDALVEAAVACLAEIGSQLGAQAGQVAGVATCTFWHSFLGTDAAGRPLTPIYTWADTRAAGEISRLRRRLDQTAVHARTGAIFHTGYWPARLSWLRRTQGRLFRRVKRWLSPGEYLYLRLLGAPLCSLSMASGTGLFDQNRLDWDDEVLAALGVDREQLSPLVDLDSPARGLRPEWRERLPYLAGVPWLPAIGDGAGSNVGSGCLDRAHLALMLGTSGAMRVLFEAAEAQAPLGLWLYRIDRRRYLMGGALSNGGNLLAWLHATLRLEMGPAMEAELAALPPDGHGLTVLPFLAGERNPGYSPGATATFSGLRWTTRPVEILQAGLEAVAYRMALIHELLQPQLAPGAQIIASGGAFSALPYWAQIMADVLGRPVAVSREAEASSRGAALLAAESLDLIADAGAAPPELGAVYAPDPARHERYRAGLERQRSLYRKLVKGALRS